MSHNMKAVTDLCSRCIIIANGVVDSLGYPVDIVNKYIDRFEEKKIALYGNSEFLTIESIAINNSTESKEVYLDESINISVCFTCHVGGKRLSPNVNLLTSSGVLIFCSHQINPIITEKDITYISTCTIPENFLQDDLYYIDFATGNPNPLETYVYYSRVLMFKVKDSCSGNTSRGEVLARLPGIIAPKLHWNTKKKEN